MTGFAGGGAAEWMAGGGLQSAAPPALHIREKDLAKSAYEKAGLCCAPKAPWSAAMHRRIGTWPRPINRNKAAQKRRPPEYGDASPLCGPGPGHQPKAAKNRRTPRPSAGTATSASHRKPRLRSAQKGRATTMESGSVLKDRGRFGQHLGDRPGREAVIGSCLDNERLRCGTLITGIRCV